MLLPYRFVAQGLVAFLLTVESRNTGSMFARIIIIIIMESVCRDIVRRRPPPNPRLVVGDGTRRLPLGVRTNERESEIGEGVAFLGLSLIHI